MSDVQQLVDDVGTAEAAGVEDRRLAASVVADDPDQAVADPAELVADLEGRHTLELHEPSIEAQAPLPGGHQGAVAIVHGNDNESQSI